MENLVISETFPNPHFWRGKRVLLTGHTGFKGAWLAIWLNRLGAKVTGISLAPVTTPDLYRLAGVEGLTTSHFSDIRDATSLARLIEQARPEVVFHLAAQALVRPSYRAPLETIATNVQGTANLLDGLRDLETVRSIVCVTTDKVYQNLEHAYPYRETDALGGHDPYSASKAASEIIIDSYRKAFLAEQGVAVATARAGNVIGGGDWSEDRLIADAVRAWASKQPLQIRRPEATRPWQHVLEPLCGYLRLAEKLWHEPEMADAYNFGPETHEAATVREVSQLAREAYGAGEIIWGDASEGPHEAGWLALEVAKARNILGARPVWSLEESVWRTMHWYKSQQNGTEARVLCDEDINSFEAAMQADHPT